MGAKGFGKSSTIPFSLVPYPPAKIKMFGTVKIIFLY